MITSLAVAIFSLVFVGAFFVQAYAGKVSELGSAIKRNVVPSSLQLNPKANCKAVEELSDEDSLEDLENAYYYKMTEGKDVHINDGQIEDANPSKVYSCETCVQINNCQFCDC